MRSFFQHAHEENLWPAFVVCNAKLLVSGGLCNADWNQGLICSSKGTTTFIGKIAIIILLISGKNEYKVSQVLRQQSDQLPHLISKEICYKNTYKI
jgi:hypothetical protein